LKTFKWFIPPIIAFIFIVGCRDEMGNPRPADFLKNDNADIFLLDGIVYSNVEHVDWVTEIKYKVGKQIGEISKQTNKSWKFKNGSANKLPLGAKIYQTDTEITIVIVEDKEIPYIKIVEG
jgi:hypothetical protein